MDTEISFETLPRETREKLKERGLNWRLRRLESGSGGFLKFSTTGGTLSQVVDLSIACFTTQDARDWSQQEATKKLELKSPNTAETVSEATLFPGTLYAEGWTLETRTKQFFVISGSGIYSFLKGTKSDE